jgi:hypothetical protein
VATEPANSDQDYAGDDVPLIERAFGAENRERLISRFLSSSKDDPWKAVYKLLLWVDATTGLARCYESDKCQPGKPWHSRTLRFHDWLAGAFGVEPIELVEHLDWLFRRVAEDYTRFMVKASQRLRKMALAQRAPYADRNFPAPGDDPEVEGIVREVLGGQFESEPTREQWRQLTLRIRELIGAENKRKNIVGEGFEDVLAAVVRRAAPSGVLDVQSRRLLYSIPGFANRIEGTKPPKVDLAIVRPADNKRILVTAKWSTRADREEQFGADFSKYVQARSQNDPFEYVLVTNEFDPARLQRACELNAANAWMFARVVHISPDALRSVYGDKPTKTMQAVLDYIDSGRIVGLDNWVGGLA